MRTSPPPTASSLSFARLSAVVVVAAAGLSLVASSPARAAVAIEQRANGFDRGFERLPDLRLIRGAKHKDMPLAISADEAWSVTTDQPWMKLECAAPCTVANNTASSTGDGAVTVRFDDVALNAVDGAAGHVVITGGTSNATQILDVSFDVWPKLSTASTPEELRAYARDPAHWPHDGFGGAWELWGFLPDDTSHPGQDAGQNLDSWEKTPCPAGADPSRDDCVHAGQAGLTSGMSADQAWLLSTGDPRIVIGELDSGIKWSERSLNTKFYLNARELRACPPPGADANAVDPFAAFDVNGDGVFNIRDYDDAAWLVDVNENGLHDPEDLIWGTFEDGTLCSDGVDADGNGYTDDISGWDFYWNDNDPSDDADFGHGTGEANDSTAEANDDDGTPGVCPRCLVMPVRVGDSFIADVNQFADGVVFTVESGASIVQEALGTLNNTPYAQAAIDWAYDNNVPVIASAADETSFHHNYPGSLEHTLYVHAIVWDDDGHNDEFSASTFLNFNNCTNFGPHLMLSTPGSGCSSEATGKTAGQTALLLSYFRQLQDAGGAYYGTPLTAEEVYQTLVASADDIDVPGAETDAQALALLKFPSNQGWDLHFGYGRNNARKALELLRDQKVPAAADITSPRWFQVFDPQRTASFDVEGDVDSPRDTDIHWELFVAEGAVGKDFVKVGEGDGPVHGVVGSVDLSPGGPLKALVARAADPAGNDPDQFTATLELRTFAKGGHGDEVRGVFRKAFGVRIDPDVHDGFPLYVGASGESSPKLTDLDGDGGEEIVVATADGLIHAFKDDGGELPGFPVGVGAYLPMSDGFCAPQAGDPSPKCHRTARPYASGAIDPASLRQSVLASVAVGDLDGDGAPCRDIVAASIDGFLFAFDCEGHARAGFPVEIHRDTLPDGQDGARRCEDANGNPVIGCRSEQQHGEGGFFAAPLLVDLDGDGSLEIVEGGMDQFAYAWHGDGSEVNGWPVHIVAPGTDAFDPNGSIQRFDDRIVSSPAVGDLFGDGTPLLFFGSNERIAESIPAFLYAVYPDGNAHPGGPFPPHWPTTVNGFISEEILPYVGRGNPNSPATADIDGDGKDEVIAAGMGGILQVYGEDGTAKLVMKSTSDKYGENATSHESLSLPVINNPSVADLDGDGLLEILDGTAGSGLIQVAQQGGRRHEFDHQVSAWVAASGVFQAGFPQRIWDYQFFMNYAVADLEGTGRFNVISGDGGYFVYAPNVDGDQPPGWPKWTQQWDIVTPAIGDLDGDQKIDVVVNTREGWLWAWKTPGHVGGPQASKVPAIQWESFHHDDHNTGNYGGPLKPYPRLGPPDDGCDGGCCCSASATNVAASPLTGALALAALLGTLAVRRRKRA